MLTRIIRQPFARRFITTSNNTNTNTNINNALLQEVKEIKVHIEYGNKYLSRIYLATCLLGGMALGDIVGTITIALMNK